MRDPSRPQQGVQSVEIGLRLAYSLARAGKPVTLGELAQAASLPPSKTHRYLVSLVRAGLVAQDARDQRYRLGGAAIFIGLSAQNMLDEYRLLGEAIESLHDETGYAVAVMIWGSFGPTVVRRLEPLDQPIMVVARIGANITITNSASGRLFAAFMPPSLVKPLVEKEFGEKVNSAATGKPIGRREFARIVEQVRADRLSSVESEYRFGYSTLSAPVFRPPDEMIFAITMIAPSGAIDVSPTGRPAQALRDCVQRLEANLGQPPAI
jgi:DNA-binding IclR family transcriptional regulator